MTHRWIDLDGLVNMRDLGGLPTRDGGVVAEHRLIRSDNLQDLTPADVEVLVERLGVSDVVDLRSEAEIHLEGPGPLWERDSITHHHHSFFAERRTESLSEIARKALVLPWKQQPTRDRSFWADHYLGYLARRPDSVSGALRVVAGASGATVVHCAAGKDRTGTLVAVALDVAGVPHEEIVADYVLTAERLEGIMERLRDRPAYREALSTQSVGDQVPHPEAIIAILTALTDGWGGAPGWLREQGWAAADVERLRDRLTR